MFCFRCCKFPFSPFHFLLLLLVHKSGTYLLPDIETAPARICAPQHLWCSLLLAKVQHKAQTELLCCTTETAEMTTGLRLHWLPASSASAKGERCFQGCVYFPASAVSEHWGLQDKSLSLGYSWLEINTKLFTFHFYLFHLKPWFWYVGNFQICG